MNPSQSLRSLLKAFEFQDAFIDCLGWDRQGGLALLEAAGRTFFSRPIAKKGSVTVVEITEQEPPEGQPRLTAAAGRTLRAKIEQQSTQRYGVCVLAFINADRNECYWRFPRSDGKGSYPERRYYKDRTNIESLLAVMRHLDIPYELQNEFGEVAHSLMLDKLAASSAQADKVTTKFFKEFASNRKDFEGFLKWVDDEKQRKWYVTALLNRVMFIYFLQERGLLPDKNQYLLNQLAEWQLRGTDRFYRDFLLPLCFFGFGSKQGERGSFEADFAGVPYLDGGLFEVHEVEAKLGITKEAVLAGTLPANIVIPDAEFLRWFQFLGSWRWTLDEENPENERQINPGILGYIFEKYINQKELGAYYTKEDITGYICRNTIIPRLFDMLAETGSKGKKAVDPLPIGPHPNLLNDGKGISQGEGIDRYIWPAVKTTDFLPTETEREYAARQERYASILQDFEEGKLLTINDGITYNLNLELLARDFVLTIQDPEILWLFYEKCLKQITILDPTVGSGAFLLAAVNILYPLYVASLSRMEHFCQAEAGTEAPLLTWKGEFSFANEVDSQQTFMDPAPASVLQEMRGELSRIHDEHANAEYFIHKTIIVNNLYGVDLVEEAVEICKLRLFLKLIAHAQPDPKKKNQGIEPLPDVDFNVLAGNSLVGYSRLEDIDRLRQSVSYRRKQSAMLFGNDPETLKRLCREYGLVLQNYRDQQLGLPVKNAVTKEKVRKAADLTRTQLDEDLWNLHRDAGIYPDPPARKQKDFLHSHQPFHWFLEFAAVFERGGFDCAVGNPPYLERSKLGGAYSCQGYATAGCPDIYAWVVERTSHLLGSSGRRGLIIPVSVSTAGAYSSLRNVIMDGQSSSWFAFFAHRPSQLFVGAGNRLCIVLSTRKACHTTPYRTSFLRWDQGHGDVGERTTLFQRLCYYKPIGSLGKSAQILKIGTPVSESILEKVSLHSPIEKALDGPEGDRLYWVRVPGYFCQFFKTPPMARPIAGGPERQRGELLSVTFASAALRDAAHAALNSTLFYFYFSCTADGRHINPSDVRSFPLNLVTTTCEEIDHLQHLSAELEEAMKRSTSHWRKSGLLIDSVNSAAAKPILDRVDAALAKLYGLTDDELSFVVNYDIKYRLGKGSREVGNESEE